MRSISTFPQGEDGFQSLPQYNCLRYLKLIKCNEVSFPVQNTLVILVTSCSWFLLFYCIFPPNNYDVE